MAHGKQCSLIHPSLLPIERRDGALATYRVLFYATKRLAMVAPIAESISTLALAFASRLTIAALTLVEEAAIWNAMTPPNGPALFARIFVSIYSASEHGRGRLTIRDFHKTHVLNPSHCTLAIRARRDRDIEGKQLIYIGCALSHFAIRLDVPFLAWDI